jgi:hypothetical protein
VAYGVLSAAYTGNLHPLPNEIAWIEQLIRTARLRADGRWTSRVRKGRASGEEFVCGGVWQATDALRGAPLEDAHHCEGMWWLTLDVNPWEYCVFHLTSKGGERPAIQNLIHLV